MGDFCCFAGGYDLHGCGCPCAWLIISCGKLCSFRKLIRFSCGILLSWLPGMRYPFSRPSSNHLLTVRGATWVILAIWPVV